MIELTRGCSKNLYSATASTLIRVDDSQQVTLAMQMFVVASSLMEVGFEDFVCYASEQEMKYQLPYDAVPVQSRSCWRRQSTNTRPLLKSTVEWSEPFEQCSLQLWTIDSDQSGSEEGENLETLAE